MSYQLDFGQNLADSGWTILLMTKELSDDLSKGLNPKAREWLNQKPDKYLRVSYRRIAFKSVDDAILFKLMFG